jgi:hypothetical protein
VVGQIRRDAAETSVGSPDELVIWLEHADDR